MSGGTPSRQRSLKDRLKDAWPRRRGSQGSNPLKGGRPYVIPTTTATTNKSKATSGDSHGYINPVEWEFPSKSRSVEECNTMAASDSTSSGLAKTPPGSFGERPHQSSGENPRKAPVRNVTQPEGTFAYTVDKNDTLTSIAARFETTPSELAKINRLVSRLICPGKVIFVPEKSVDEVENVAERQSSSPMKDQLQQQGNHKLESPPSDSVQCSPKPGRAERICDSPSPPHRTPIKILSKEEERKLDQECMERFLKINGVKHITDGQGVVSGVLLVTPNAAMFEPSVMETLVSERGIDKYHVSAPLQNVANAALYTDIAHMKVRHAPVQTANLPPPEIYFPKHGHPSMKSQISGESPAGQPRRSESQQAIKGSVSDKTDLDMSEEDEGDDDSVGSCRSERSKGSEKSASSEVFADSSSDAAPERPDSGDKGPGGPREQQQQTGKPRPVGDRKRTEGSVRFSDLDYECPAVADAPEVPKSDLVAQTPAQDRFSPKKSAVRPDEDGLVNGRVSFPDAGGGGGFSIPKEAKRGLPQFPFLPDSLWPMSQSLPSSARTEQGGTVVVPRKHSIPEVPQAAEKARQKVLKRLSYPIAAEVTAEAPEDTAAPLDLASAAVQGPSTLSRILNVPRTLVDLSGVVSGSGKVDPEQQQGQQTALSRMLNSPRTLADLSGGGKADLEPQGTPQQQTALSRILNSPRQLVDFSTGLFQRNANIDTTRVEDVSQFQRQMSYSLPTPLPVADGCEVFFGERRGSSPEGVAAPADARNAHVALGRRFSDGTSGSDNHRLQDVVVRSSGQRSSREDIKIEFKSEVTMEDKKDLFQNIEVIGAIPEDFEIVPVPARSCDDPPLYLCLRMGRPAKTKATSPASTNGRLERRPKKPLKSEYWFSIPKDRVDELYHFLEQWAPGAYGNLEEIDLKERGLELISSDEVSDEELEGVSRRTSDMAEVTHRRTGLLGETHPDWENFKIFKAEILLAKLRRDQNRSSPDSEVVSMNDVRENRLSNMSFDLELPLPELIGESEILTEEHRREIFKVLPARAEGYSWSLIFSAAEHGFSLQSIYRRMARYESPVLLIIQDTENNVFGAMTSCILKTSDHFYGTGESFLFTFYPQFKTFKWTGENVFFIKGNPDCLAIGAGEGLFGLWLDGDLYHGRSHRCKTYNNDTLSSNEDFCVKMLEAWGFVDFGVSDSSLC